MGKGDPTHIVHGVQFIRSGTCNRCGICCVDETCSHYAVINNVPTCKIYNKRNQSCQEHGGITHSVCVAFPDHPWLKVIKNGECSYQFMCLNAEEEAKKNALDETWQ